MLVMTMVQEQEKAVGVELVLLVFVILHAGQSLGFLFLTICPIILKSRSRKYHY